MLLRLAKLQKLDKKFKKLKVEGLNEYKKLIKCYTTKGYYLYLRLLKWSLLADTIITL